MSAVWRVLGVAMLFVAAMTSAAEEQFVTVSTRGEFKQSFLYIRPAAAVAIVVLYAGGNGKIELGPDGPGKRNNFLVRSRQLFASEGFVVAVPDAPSDLTDRRDGLDDRRSGKDHADDTRAIITYLRQKNALPVFVVGTSRGTISAANAGARLGGDVDGVVLTASVTQAHKKRPENVFDVDLEEIRVPVLLVHHKDDGCRVTPSSGTERIKDKLKASPRVDVVEVDGGDPPQSKPCGALSQHGFLGIEQQVVSAIGHWIKSVQKSDNRR